MDGTHNNYGVRSVVLYVDTTEVFRSTVDGVLPEENRMIKDVYKRQQYHRTLLGVESKVTAFRRKRIFRKE